MVTMKAMNANAMTKGDPAEALSTSTETKKSVCGQILNSLAEIVTQEVYGSFMKKIGMENDTILIYGCVVKTKNEGYRPQV